MADSNYKIRPYDFGSIEDEFKNISGKTSSLYMVVLFECGVEELLKHTFNKVRSTGKIKDAHLRARARKANFNLKEFGGSFEENERLSYLLMMDVERDNLEIFKLSDNAVELLTAYECPDIWIRCDNHYDLTILKDYLESDDYYNLFRVKNNKVSHIKLGMTKKVVANSEESKTLNLPEYIESRLDSNSKYLAYGVSSKLASLNNTDIRGRAYDVLSHDISDSNAIDFIIRMQQSDLLDRMDDDYEFIQNPKTMHRVIFKKDFKPDKIAILQRIYIDKRILEKFKENCEKGGVDISFEIITIDSSIKDFQEGRESRLFTELDGVMGFTYY